MTSPQPSPSIVATWSPTAHEAAFWVAHLAFWCVVFGALLLVCAVYCAIRQKPGESRSTMTALLVDDEPRAVARLADLQEWDELLGPESGFHRLGRSLIVRLPALRSTQWQSRDQTLLFFTGVAEPLPIGRTAAARLREILDAT